MPTDAPFSWTARRITLPDVHCAKLRHDHTMFDRLVARLRLDVRIRAGRRECRLLTFAADDVDYVALLVGTTYGGHDVPIRIVDAETILLEGARSAAGSEILLSVTSEDGPAASTPLRRDAVYTQLCNGGPIRDMLMLVDIDSVDIDWCDTPRRTESARGTSANRRNRPYRAGCNFERKHVREVMA